MHNILFCCATSKELNVVRKAVKKFKFPLKIDFLQLWIWNYNTIFSLSEKLKVKKYDFVVNVWICWVRWNFNKIEKFYQIANIFDLWTTKELIVPVFFKFWKFATCISDNKPIIDLDDFLKKIKILENSSLDQQLNTKKEYSSQSLFVLDMESYWFEFVLDKFVIPRILLKVPVDTNENQLLNIDYERSINLLWKNINYEKLLLNIKNFIDENKKTILNLDKYFSELYFSESLKNEFVFLYRKYNFLIKEDFDYFFYSFIKKHKWKNNKKELAKKLINEMKNYLKNYL